MSSSPQTTAALRSIFPSTEGVSVHTQPRDSPPAIITAVFLGCCHLNLGSQLASSGSTRLTLLKRAFTMPISRI